MKLVLLFVVSSWLVLVPASGDDASAFAEFAKKYGKSYDGVHNFLHRFGVFKANLGFVKAHNADPSQTYSVDINQFGDLSLEEWRTQYLGVQLPSNFSSTSSSTSLGSHQSGGGSSGTSPFAPYPANWDWRTHVPKVVAPIEDQGQCGSCWAFSAKGAIEGIEALICNTDVVPLSAQQLIDCSGNFGNAGCGGGWMDNAFKWVIQHGGIATASSYPYKGGCKLSLGRWCEYAPLTATNGVCNSAAATAATISQYTDVRQGDEASLMGAVAIQPVAVAVEADQRGFQFYSSGVFSGTCGTNLNHAVLAIGWGVTTGKTPTPYWLLKNQWGTSWGTQGFMNMVYGRDQCGIALAASYPQKFSPPLSPLCP